MTKRLQENPRIDEDWYATAFSGLYPILYSHRTIASARPEVDFAMEQVGLCSADTILDLCCGNGRHMVHLASTARHTIGLDYSRDLLRIAAEAVGAKSELILGDMRALPFRDCLDVVCNFFTSFGYFQSSEENEAVVHDIAQALKPKGRFFLDYLNPPHVAATIVPRSVREEEGYRIVDERWIDAEEGRINKRTIVTRGEQVVRETGESVQMYTLAELEAMLAAQHLAVDNVFGDYDGTPLSDTQPRTILVGHKE